MANYHDMEMRVVYAQTLDELIEADPNVLCLEADLAKASGTIPEVSKRNPSNFIDVGRLGGEHDRPRRRPGRARARSPSAPASPASPPAACYDQITISVAYANNNVKIVGTAPGITQGPNGGTHMCFLDLAIMRAMPNMHVYSPCDAYELRAIMRHMAASRSSRPTCR